VISTFFEMLYSCKLSQGNVDRLYWSPSRKCVFEVKSFYKVLSNPATEMFPWKSIWRTRQGAVKSGVLWVECSTWENLNT
jgi:hypothetical protein